MPVYEFFCETHKTFEVQQGIKDEPLAFCPQCKADGVDTPVKKLISLGAFHLVGGGWASDNYK